MVPLEETYLWRWLAGRVPVGTSRIRGSVRHPVHRAKSKFERPLHIEVYPQYSIYDGLDFLIINRGAARLLVAVSRLQTLQDNPRNVYNSFPGNCHGIDDEASRTGPKGRCYRSSDPRLLCCSPSLTLLSIRSAYVLTAGSLVGLLSLRLSRSALLLSCSRRACSSCSTVARLRASCWATLSFVPSSTPAKSARILVTSPRFPIPLCRSL
jgi:hypothetical protein